MLRRPVELACKRCFTLQILLEINGGESRKLANKNPFSRNASIFATANMPDKQETLFRSPDQTTLAAYYSISLRTGLLKT